MNALGADSVCRARSSGVRVEGMERDAAKEWTTSTRTEGCFVWHSRGSTAGEGNVVLKERKKKRIGSERGLWGRSGATGMQLGAGKSLLLCGLNDAGRLPVVEGIAWIGGSKDGRSTRA